MIDEGSHSLPVRLECLLEQWSASKENPITQQCQQATNQEKTPIAVMWSNVSKR